MLEKNDEKTEKYSTNERIMYKHTRPNKWRWNKQSTWKRIQNNDSKDASKTWKYNGENARNI